MKARDAARARPLSGVLPEPGSRRHHGMGFWAVALTFLALAAFTTVPSPLYALYQARDGFSELMVTVIYAAYAIGVIGALAFAGHLSDWFGRRRLLIPAAGLTMASAIVFLTWTSVPGLLLARVLSGISIGIASSTATVVVGLAGTVTAVWLSTPSLALFILGGAVTGAGGGAIFKAAVGTVVRISRPESRAEALTGVYLAGFVGLSLPIVGTGVALAEGVSPRVTILAFAIAVAIGIVISAIKLLGRPRGAVRRRVLRDARLRPAR